MRRPWARIASSPPGRRPGRARPAGTRPSPARPSRRGGGRRCRGARAPSRPAPRRRPSAPGPPAPRPPLRRGGARARRTGDAWPRAPHERGGDVGDRPAHHAHEAGDDPAGAHRDGERADELDEHRGQHGARGDPLGEQGPDGVRREQRRRAPGPDVVRAGRDDGHLERRHEEQAGPGMAASDEQRQALHHAHRCEHRGRARARDRLPGGRPQEDHGGQRDRGERGDGRGEQGVAGGGRHGAVLLGRVRG